jgi:hypothetical protein
MLGEDELLTSQYAVEIQRRGRLREHGKPDPPAA